MSKYTYLFTDLLAGTVKAELPLSGVSFTSTLDAVGSFSGTLSLGDPKVLALDWVDALEEGRTAIFVDRDGVLVWGGILWTLSRSNTGASITLGGQDFWSYFARRYVTKTVAWTNVDQLVIASAIVNTAQAQPSGDIGVKVPNIASGILRSLTLPGDQFTLVSDAVQSLATLQSGFDFAIDVAYSGTPPTPTLNLTLSYPGRGRTAATSNLVFSVPGNILSYMWPEDGTSLATTVYALGSGSGPTMLRGTGSTPSLLDAGYPLLETTVPYKSTINQALLDAQAKSQAVVFGQPVVAATLNVRADADPVLGTYIVGDEARIQITDSQFPQGLDTAFRIVAMTVTPPSGATHESVALTLGPTLT